MSEGLAGDEFLERNRLPVGVGQLDPHHCFAGDRGDARGDRAHVAGDVFGQASNPAGLDARRRFEFVHGDHRPGAHCRDFALHVEIVEHVFQQPRIAFKPEFVELGRMGWRGIVQQVDLRQFVIVEQVCLAGLAGELGRHWRLAGVRDFGRSARFRPGQRRDACLSLRLGLLWHERNTAVVNSGWPSFQHDGQSQQLRPVEGEHFPRQAQSGDQRDQGKGEYGPALRGRRQQTGDGVNRLCAQQAGDAAHRCGQ